MTGVALTKCSLLPHLKVFTQSVLKAFDGPPLISLKVGLCVSGGPDSMALAILMSSLTERDLGFNIEPVAFIIDHNARPGSAEEAQAVSEQLSKFKISSYISRIQWGNEDPLRMTNFESQARRHRYVEFALAAKKYDIRHLFLGHHRDDQIESVLMRLIKTERPPLRSLRGMDANGPIPVAYSIHGARHALPDLPMQELLQTSKSEATHATIRRESSLNLTPQVNLVGGNKIWGYAPQGIQVHRPLLEFTKGDLIAICKSQSIPYVVDKTNNDPTFTARNAIRALRTHQLPKALQGDAILTLADTSRSHLNKLQARVQEYLRTVSIPVLDLTSTTATIRLPQDYRQLLIEEKPVAAGVLAHICQLVTPIPAESFQSSGTEHTLNLLLGHLESSFWMGDPERRAPRFTVSKVQFEGLLPALHNETGTTVWKISRQAMHSNEIKRSRGRFDSAPDTTKEREVWGRILTSEWMLWDSRYWMQITTNDRRILDHLVVRPFQVVDWNLFYAESLRAWRKKYQKLMSNHAPGQTRCTLPVFELGNCVIAFPTLSNQVLKTSELEHWAKKTGFDQLPKITWRVNYKVLPESVVNWISTIGKNFGNQARTV